MSAYLADQFPDIWGRKIRPLGTRPAAETAALQAAAKFIIVPSTWDVFNLSAVEGMGLGRVVVCSQGAGAAQLIRDGDNGLSFPAGDDAALTEKLRHVCGMTNAEKDHMGQAARDTVEEELEPGRIAAKRIEHYERLLKEGPKKVTASPEWQYAVGPDQASIPPTAFLDRLPLKRITRYAFKRIFDRILGRPR
jgi:glycosyltransferase involved in cell wall biosynthesis